MMTTMNTTIDVGRWIEARKHELASEIVIHSRMNDTGTLVFSDNFHQDVTQQLSLLAAAMVTQQPALFHDHLAWARSVLISRNQPVEPIERLFVSVLAVLQKQMPASAHALLEPYLAPAIAETHCTSAADHNGKHPLQTLAHEYLTKLLNAERGDAGQLIFKAIESGTRLQDLYLQVFQATQREIGRLWQCNRISVAQEHYCTAVTQTIMSQLYPLIFQQHRVGRKFLAASVGGELHEMGARVVCDFFEMHGWDSIYLGANVPVAGLIQSVQQHNPDVVGLSITMTSHLAELQKTVETLRQSPKGREMIILAGGYPFNLVPELSTQFDVNGCAADAQDAVDLATRLIAA